MQCICPHRGVHLAFPVSRRYGPLAFPHLDAFLGIQELSLISNTGSMLEEDGLGCGGLVPEDLPQCLGIHQVRIAVAEKFSIRIWDILHDDLGKISTLKLTRKVKKTSEKL